MGKESHDALRILATYVHRCYIIIQVCMMVTRIMLEHLSGRASMKRRRKREKGGERKKVRRKKRREKGGERKKGRRKKRREKGESEGKKDASLGIEHRTLCVVGQSSDC